MPIRISCQCGKALNIPDTMAGKAVKCPACGQPVRVPAATGTAPATAAVSDRMDDLFKEEGLTDKVEAVCPACRAEMQAGAVLCTSCGYHMESGVQLEAHKTAGVDIDHGTLALEAAERAMIKDAEMQQKMLSGAGMPWWALALVLFVISSAMTIAVLTVNAARREDNSFQFNAVGLFLLLSGVAFALVSLGAYWMIVVHGFKKYGGKGLLNLIPPYAIYYVCKHPRETWKFMVVSIVLGSIAGGLFAGASSQGI